MIALIAVRPSLPPAMPLPEAHATPAPRLVRLVAPPPVLPAPPRQAAVIPVPAPPKPEPPSRGKDRVSIGGAGPHPDVLELRRHEEIKVGRGTPQVGPDVASRTESPPVPPRVARADDSQRALPALAGEGAKDPAFFGRPASERPRTLGDSIRDVAERLGGHGPLGLPGAAGEQMGPLFFDPEGADFTAWINHFRSEAYLNWIIPQPALLGIGGEVKLRFVVERDGSLSELRLQKSSGSGALDRAAQNAIQGSRLMPLPPDFSPPRVTMDVVFVYGGARRQS